MGKKLNEQLFIVIQGGLSKTDTGAKGDDGLYNANLPEGVTPEIVEKVVDYTTDFVAAGTKALGVTCVDVLKANTELTEASGEISLGAMGTLETTTERMTTNTFDGKETTSYGATRAKVTFQPGVNAGALKAAKRDIKAIAAEALAPK